MLCAVSLAGCGNADKFVLVVGNVSPPLHDCAAYVDTPNQVFNKRDVKGKYMLRYLKSDLRHTSIGVRNSMRYRSELQTALWPYSKARSTSETYNGPICRSIL